ncbi:D-alanyl-D-alanine carboxypeptidase [Kitasatospora sp. MAP12-15]|uniref:serine hydrolase domain-containing protein n=1 Tax=unclassified Kitasatospora TaxID=2633591 RepID=UPI002476BE41|nr:serine hydrolase domain-containing protein [Kitasatospora sp. MAP12-44]MDH6108554.1 D-alanyl-D-alanine carboxypeptidase [Kitasatospora sp. MAP12-44]
MTRTRAALALAAATMIATSLPTTAGAVALSGAGHGPQACVRSPEPHSGPARTVLDIAQQGKEQYGLNSVILKVTVRGHDLVTSALGESMTGVPAEPDMHFRAGSVGIAYMGTVLLQLVDEHVVSLDDPIARWLPDVPHADRITLRMLGSSTSGLHDYVTDPAFLAELEAHPFRHWTDDDLLAYPFSHPLWYEPGTNWSYSHGNFVLLGEALERITGTPLDKLLEQRVMGPLGLRNTQNDFTPEIPDPVLHAFTSERGTYEESTFWNPSWTTARGAVITTDICDLARSAQAIGTGELLSPSGFRTQLDPGTVGLGGPTDTCPATVCLHNTEALHFGLTVLVENGWIIQNPSFSGYAAIQAYLPSKRLAIAVSTTKGPDSPDVNTAEAIASQIAAAFAPDNPIPGPTTGS